MSPKSHLSLSLSLFHTAPSKVLSPVVRFLSLCSSKVQTELQSLVRGRGGSVECPLFKKIMEANSSSLIIPEEADFADEEQRLLTIVLGQYVCHSLSLDA